ncbi:hypothetical protein SOVF_174810 [Spinacia oleracea]|nr:hypothetical protein SOVF_174810 [Spinacia oleracea]
MVQKSSRFLTTSFIPPTREFPKYSEEEREEEEFDECDVVWSSSSSPEKTTTTSTTAGIPAISTSSSTGLSSVLSVTEPQSPTSIQRKTTSSPVSMISSSLTRSDGHGLAGYYYGKKFHQSAPVNVPVWPTGPGYAKNRPFVGLGRFDEDDDDDDDEEMVPPHEIVARSHKATSFSVMEGAGRTLKGRDLTAVRNAVFQKTGFLE